MTDKQVETGAAATPVPVNIAPADLKSQLKFTLPTDEDMTSLAMLRSGSDPWKARGETQAESNEALTKLRPFIQIARVAGNFAGYVTIERDGPVPGAAYMRNIVISQQYRLKGLGTLVMDHALSVARDMNRKTLALRVDPSNGPAVSFYRKMNFTTVTTVLSKKSGKLRLLMSREL